MHRSVVVVATLALAALGWPSAAYGTTKYVEGSVIVTFKPSATLNDAKTALRNRTMGFAHHFGPLSAQRNRTTGVVKHPTKTTLQLIAELKADPTVESVEPDYLRWFTAVPNDSRFADMWGLQNTGQTVNSVAGTTGDDVKFVNAWSLARTPANSVVVGVIDSGVNYLHPDLIGNMWTNPGETPGNGTDDDHNGYVDDYYGYDFLGGNSNPYDSGYHGTHVAGTIAATGNNLTGVIGVNFHAKIMALKVSLDGESISSSATISALQYATAMKGKGVNIVALNASYGGGGFSSTEQAAIQAAGNAGIIFCAAAGNGDANGIGVNNDTTPTYPASYHLPNMIVVAASDQKDALASFSNYGASTVDIAAPGVNVLSTKGSISIQVGANTYQSDPFVYTGFTAGMTKPVVDCGYGGTGEFPAAVKGNIALIARGPAGNAIFFSDKVNNAKTAGAVAVIIYNYASQGAYAGTLQAAGNWLPAIAIAGDDGIAIKNALPASATLTVTGEYQYLDGTSMATPHVSGAVAFAAMNFPGDTVAQRIRRLLDNVDVKAGFSGKVASNGRLNLQKIVDANANGIADWLESPVAGAPTITSAAALPGADSSVVYSQQLTATGGSGPYTWSVVNGSLPDGLTLSSNGILSGIATTAGTSTFVVEAMDSTNKFGDQQVTLSVVVPSFAIATGAALADGMVTSDYAPTLVATGGVLHYAWAVTAGALPDGLTLAPAGGFTGFPTTAGTFHFTAEVTDGVGNTLDQDFSVVIDPAQLTITNGPSLTPGVRNVAYNQTLAATGSSSPLSWSISAGALPAGLSLNASGAISGTPSTTGVLNFTLHVADSTGLTSNQPVSIAVDALPLAITTNHSLTTGVKDAAYSQALTASGGAGPYSWSLGADPLPDGLSLDTSGQITGTPTTAGTSSFALIATDSRLRTVAVNFSLIIEAVPIAVTSPLPLIAAVKGVPYSQTITLSGGQAPFQWAVGGGSLPPGLKLSATGVISGTPTAASVYAFTLSITDSQSLSFSLPLQIAVAATYTKPVVNQPVFTTTTVGVPFNYTVSATNYPKSFAISGLPPGLTYSATTGAISGRPTVGGNYTVTVKATNPAGTSPAVTASFSVNALAPGLVGTFTGLVARDATVNGNLASLFTLTTTSTGYYTAKETTGVVTKSVVGYLTTAAPQIVTTLGTSPLSLTLDSGANTLSGTWGTAAVTAYRQTWSTAHPATSRVGYYSTGLDLADAPDQTDPTIPHGSGYATFTAASTGTLTIAGHTSDGTAFTSATIVGPGGELPVYALAYANLGSVTGTLTLADNGVTPLTDNAVSGTLTWLKPAIKSRVYGAKFGPVNLNAYGKYLAIRSTGLTILGLPAVGASNLWFADGGFEASATHQSATSFTYSATYVVTLPLAGGPSNLARATLGINRNTGLIGGTFTLVEPAPVLTRKVTFQGMIVRPAAGSVIAEGYFLLPQIPVSPQTILTSPILSGKVTLQP